MSHREIVLHAYRRILRATTYIPDSFARTYIHDLITTQFKAHATCDSKKSNANTVLDNKLKRTRRWTNRLESAADGNLDEMHNVLLRVHGRQGARKRVLVGQLIKPDEDLLPKDDKALEKLVQSPAAQSKLSIQKGTKLHALASSQQEHNPKDHIKAKLRHLDPRLPKENQWGRPTPRKLAENLTKKWWAITIDKLLPPIPRSEWERLRDLATGAIPVEEVPPRRPRGKTLPHHQVDKPSGGEELLNALRSPARPSRAGIQKLEFDASQGLKIVKPEINRKLLRNSTRARQRMYAGIWILSPTMFQEEKMIEDQVTKQWVVEWGGYKSKFLNGSISKPSVRDQELFEGIDGCTDNSEAQAATFLRERAASKSERNRARKAEAQAEHLKEQEQKTRIRQENVGARSKPRAS